MHQKKLYGTATVGTKGQIVIPADAREEMGIQTGDRLYVIGSPEKKVVCLLNEDQLEHLIEKRSTSSIATAYKNSADGFAEPLITIWEPKSYPVLLAFLAQGYSCPRKVLINSDTHLLEPLDDEVLTNVNTTEDFEKIKHHLTAKAANTPT